ncbi:uncharacterized protein [Paralichthys olivaceus]|uniref:uncharacterized protein n=1 Tax=Paralichthys olivaceus TaxID=8255 RepID=UPI00097D55C4|nr:PREDICTED: uncharacterized protein LOC109645405 [Paralichthys olivaceus]
MELHMLNHKRRLSTGCEKEPQPCAKKCFTSVHTLLDRYQTHHSYGATQHTTLRANCGGHLCTCEAENLTTGFFEQISSWSDTQCSVEKILDHLEVKENTDAILLDNRVNKKFLEFHRDITEECGAEEKQHSWAVVEKREEIVMYGPYYPNYSKGEHSEDFIIKQTQELLEDDFSRDWKVYVFTMNSPCLARNINPCMINLVQKAQEWWRVYGVKTHIGFVRCWGFKGSKETLFRDINYSQVDCINQTENHEEYVKAATDRTDLNPLCKNLSSAVKRLLRSVNLSFPLMSIEQAQDWKCYFKKTHSIYESKPEDEKKDLTQKLNAAIGAAQALLSEKIGSFDEHLESGKAFTLDQTFGFSVSDVLRDEVSLTFQQCWKEMVQDKYAEFIRGKLMEEFNQCAVQLFIKDIVKFTNEYLHIGRIQFSEEESKGQKLFGN